MDNRLAQKEKWEFDHVQKVVHFHNQLHGSSISIKGRACELHPELNGKTNWDWICVDSNGEEIAVEVKRLTIAKLEERSRILWDLLERVQASVNSSGKLEGTYFLFFDIPRDSRFPFRRAYEGTRAHSLLCSVIYQVAPVLKLNETADLIPHLSETFPFITREFMVTLKKIAEEGSYLYKSVGTIGFESPSFDDAELLKFEALIRHANDQLEKASTSETILVLIEEGFRPIEPEALGDAIRKISPQTYFAIKYAYFIRADKVVPILLPGKPHK